MKLKDGYILREIAGEYLLMPVGDNMTNGTGALVLNSVSGFILSNMKESISRDELLEKIVAEYDIDCDVAAADLDEVIELLKSYDILE